MAAVRVGSVTRGIRMVKPAASGGDPSPDGPGPWSVRVSRPLAAPSAALPAAAPERRLQKPARSAEVDPVGAGPGEGGHLDDDAQGPGPGVRAVATPSRGGLRRPGDDGRRPVHARGRLDRGAVTGGAPPRRGRRPAGRLVPGDLRGELVRAVAGAAAPGRVAAPGGPAGDVAAVPGTGAVAVADGTPGGQSARSGGHARPPRRWSPGEHPGGRRTDSRPGQRPRRARQSHPRPLRAGARVERSDRRPAEPVRA